jgi:hypothetical protein
MELLLDIHRERVESMVNVHENMLSEIFTHLNCYTSNMTNLIIS